MELFYKLVINKEFPMRKFTLNENGDSLKVKVNGKKEDIRILVKKYNSGYLDIRTGLELNDLCKDNDVKLIDVSVEDTLNDMFYLKDNNLKNYIKKLDYIKKSFR